MVVTKLFLPSQWMPTIPSVVPFWMYYDWTSADTIFSRQSAHTKTKYRGYGKPAPLLKSHLTGNLICFIINNSIQSIHWWIFFLLAWKRWGIWRAYIFYPCLNGNSNASFLNVAQYRDPDEELGAPIFFKILIEISQMYIYPQLNMAMYTRNVLSGSQILYDV